MSVSQTVRPFIYCIQLVYIHYHGSTSCIHHYVINVVNDLWQVFGFLWFIPQIEVTSTL